MHVGVDIPSNDGEFVNAIDSGYIACINDPARTLIVITPSTTSTKGWYYGHLSNVPSWFKVGTYIQKGEYLGCVAKFGYLPSSPLFGFNHLHFQWASDKFITPNPNTDDRTGYANPLEYLTPQPTQSVHIKRDSIFFLPDKSHNLKNRFKPNAAGMVIVSGKVDIAVRAYTDIQGGWNGKYAGVYKIGYEIEGPDPSSSSDDVPFRVLAEFTGKVDFGPVGPYDKIYLKYQSQFPPENGWFRNTYIVTNCGPNANPGGLGNVQENCWDTDSLPMGIYKVRIYAWAYGIASPASEEVKVKVGYSSNIYVASNRGTVVEKYNEEGKLIKTIMDPVFRTR